VLHVSQRSSSLSVSGRHILVPVRSFVDRSPPWVLILSFIHECSSPKLDILFSAASSFAASMAGPMSSQTLTEGWEFKQTDGEEWLPVARVPTNVHLDLIDNKK